MAYNNPNRICFNSSADSVSYSLLQSFFRALPTEANHSMIPSLQIHPLGWLPQTHASDRSVVAAVKGHMLYRDIPCRVQNRSCLIKDVCKAFKSKPVRQVLNIVQDTSERLRVIFKTWPCFRRVIPWMFRIEDIPLRSLESNFQSAIK